MPKDEMVHVQFFLGEVGPKEILLTEASCTKDKSMKHGARRYHAKHMMRQGYVGQKNDERCCARC